MRRDTHRGAPPQPPRLRLRVGFETHWTVRKAVQQLERNEAVGIRLDVPTEEEVFLQVGRGEVALDLPTRGLHPRRRE